MLPDRAKSPSKNFTWKHGCAQPSGTITQIFNKTPFLFHIRLPTSIFRISLLKVEELRSLARTFWPDENCSNFSVRTGDYISLDLECCDVWRALDNGEIYNANTVWIIPSCSWKLFHSDVRSWWRIIRKISLLFLWKFHCCIFVAAL